MKDVWEKGLFLLAQKVNQKSFDVWLKPLRILTLAEEQIEIEVPNKFFRDWLSENYLNLIKETLFQITSRRYSIHFTLKNGVEEKEIKDKEDDKPSSNMIRNSKPALREDGVNPQFAFDAFVVGSCNQFAHAAALAVANLPAKNYNPLFIYGGVGLGKTHLINAIGNHIIKNDSALKVCYLSSEKFTNELINCIRYEKMADFRNKYRKKDVLLIDDIQFLGGKERTQEEFFHTFNALYDSHKQIVITSDCTPKSMPLLEERLRSRFEWGLIVDIQPPDYETRLAILQSKARRKGVNVTQDVLELVAREAHLNIRSLEGSLNRVIAYARLLRVPPTAEIATRALEDVAHKELKLADITPSSIIAVVAECFQLTREALAGRQRDRDTALARRLAMYLIRQETDCSLAEIGQELGGRTPATVSHAYQKIAGDVNNSPSLRRKIFEIQQDIHSSPTNLNRCEP